MKTCPTCKSTFPDDANFCPQESCATESGPQRLVAKTEQNVRFERIERLGGEGTGEVWRATDTKTGAPAAYKIVGAAAVPTAAAATRAERELKQLARVSHPHIAQIIETGRTPDERLYVAMEFCEGESLERLLRNGPFSLDRAKRIVAQVGQALLEAQKAGVVHRDVAPKNFLLSAAGDVKVINFALARHLNEKVAGVAAYLSPEQAQGKPVDQRSNTYSLAAVLYHLLTGEAPFQGPSDEAVLEMHINSLPLAPSQRRAEANLPAEVDRVILKALDKNSSRRHLTLRLFLSEVEAIETRAAAPHAAPGAPKQEVGFAKTMLFAGGQSDVAEMVAKAIAARNNSPVTPPPVAVAPPSAVPPAARAPTTPPPVAGPSSQQVHASGGAVSRLTPPPVTPMPPVAIAAPAAPAPAGRGAPGAERGTAFRETLWFKKGDVEQMIADAKAKMGKAAEVEAEAVAPEDARPIEDRYRDDGTVTVDDRKKFSLRTGGTAAVMPVARAPLAGEGMSERDVIREIEGGSRKTMLFVVAAAVLAVIAIVVVMMSRKGSPSSSAATPGKPVASSEAHPVVPPSGGESPSKPEKPVVVEKPVVKAAEEPPPPADKTVARAEPPPPPSHTAVKRRAAAAHKGDHKRKR